MSTKTYQQLQLEATPERALPFLRAVATNQQIRFTMANAGYNDAEQAEGWKLLLASTGYATQKLPITADTAARQAIAELDDWDESGYRRIHAALERFHPAQDAVVFAGLEPSRGPTAVLGVAKLLDRLDQLEKGSAQDRAAIATLEKRGITGALRAHLRSLVAIAQSAKSNEGPVETPIPDAQLKALEALYTWHRDWAETARAVIRRRDHLILMGLAKRRSRKDDDLNSDDSDITHVTTAPLVPAAPAAGASTTTVTSPGGTSAAH